MRILHVTDHYPPRLGGIEAHVAGLAQRQAGRGDRVTVLTSTPAAADGRAADDHGPVRVLRARSVVEVSPFDFSAYDVVHAHVSVLAPFTSRLAALAARRGVPTVVTVHSLWNGLGPLAAAAAGLAGLRGAPAQWSAVSGVAAEQLARWLPGEAAVLVLPNGVDVPPRDPRDPRDPVPGEPVRLVSTMRLARRKRPLPLLEAFAALRSATPAPVRLTIVGDGPMRSHVERRARRADLRGSVEVTGRLAPAEVLRTLHDADVYVAPAVLESFGLAALEARCVGVPVVGRSAGGMGEFVHDGVEGWLADTDAGLVDRLRDLVEDAALRQRVAEHNRTVPSGLTWAHAVACNDRAYAAAAGAPATDAALTGTEGT